MWYVEYIGTHGEYIHKEFSLWTEAHGALMKVIRERKVHQARYKNMRNGDTVGGKYTLGEKK